MLTISASNNALPKKSNVRKENKLFNQAYANTAVINSALQRQNYENYSKMIGIYNKSLVSFKGYDGDREPSKKLFWILSGSSNVCENHGGKFNLYKDGHTGWKKWVKTPPEDLLKGSAKDAIETICTMNKQQDCYPKIPSFIPTPNYGEKWGRRANFIEINPRTIALTEGDKKSEGLLNLIKLLPAIPPSPDSFANCIILSQLYPAMYNENDGKTGYSSLYTANLHSGLSKNLISDKLHRGGQRMGADEQVKAFNDLAHYRGLKTGIRMPLSAGQMTVQNRPFDWYNDEKAFIDACCWAVDLGFDAIYFDSAKHVGFYDMGNYCGSGDLPNFKQMQYITHQIKAKTGRDDIALIGEKCNKDYRFKEMGLSAGTDWGKADHFDSVMHEYDEQRYNDEYAAGPEVSNDNDYGDISLEQRLNRVRNVFNAFREPYFKLPSFMQMTDLYPLSPFSNTHELMMQGENKSAFGDIDSHYNNIFDTSEHADWYRNSVYNEFAKVMYR